MPLLPEQTQRQIPEIRILIVEISPKHRSSHENNLRSWGFTPIVAEGTGIGLIEQAKKLSLKHRCQISLIDLRLIDQNKLSDTSGLHLAKQIHPSLPILFIDEDEEVSLYDHNKPLVFEFLIKSEDPQNLFRIIQKALSHLGIGKYGAQHIIWSNPESYALINQMLQQDRPSAPDDQAYELIQRLFPGHQRIVLTPIAASQLTSEQTSAPRHHSSVFHTTVDGQAAQRIVKLAREDKIAREIRNHRSYVKDKLKANSYPLIEAEALLWDLGGIVYSAVGSPQSEPAGGPQTLATAYRTTKQPQWLLKLLHHFFEEVWNNWYTTQVEALDDSLFLAYDLCWSGKLSAELPGWRAISEPLRFTDALLTLPDPRRWLADHHEESRQVQGARSAVTHGDLHGDNLLVDSQNIWSIDFERTGPGPILRDFVELTQDLLTRVARFSAVDVSVFYELAVAICTPVRPNQPMPTSQAIDQHPEAHKAFTMVQELQLLAARRTHYRDRREYLWGLLLNSLFVARMLPEHEPRREITLLLAAVICNRLAHWDKRSWRPMDLSAVRWIKPSQPQIRIPETGHTLPRLKSQGSHDPDTNPFGLHRSAHTSDKRDQRDDLASRSAWAIEDLNRRFNWGLDQAARQAYLTALLPLLPSTYPEEALRQTVQFYHLDHELVEALRDASHPNHQAAWEDARLRVIEGLKDKGFERYTDQSVGFNDLVQIALLDLATSLPRFRFGSRLATWLHVVTLNSARRTLRPQRMAGRAGVQVPSDQATDEALALPTAAHPEALTDYQLLLDLITQTLKQHNDRQLLRIFQLWALDDQRLLDISTELHWSKSRVAELLDEVRVTLQDYLRAQHWLDDH